jgi:hypothetical protein
LLTLPDPGTLEIPEINLLCTTFKRVMHLVGGLGVPFLYTYGLYVLGGFVLQQFLNLAKHEAAGARTALRVQAPGGNPASGQESGRSGNAARWLVWGTDQGPCTPGHGASTRGAAHLHPGKFLPEPLDLTPISRIWRISRTIQ